MQTVDRHPRPLSLRRTVLLERIHIARQETAEVGRYLAADLHATDRTRRSILGGLKILKASLIAAGVIWSLNASSRMGRGSRLLTVAFSLLSTLRTLRRLSAFFIPLVPITGRSHHEYRSH